MKVEVHDAIATYRYPDGHIVRREIAGVACADHKHFSRKCGKCRLVTDLYYNRVKW